MRLFYVILISCSMFPISYLIYYITENGISFHKLRDYMKRNKKNTESRRQRKGSLGENEVVNHLKLLDEKEYRVFHNLLFHLKNDVTVQIDHIVVSRTGIYVIETKNYGGEVLQTKNDYWRQTWYKMNYGFYSPLKQNESHIKSLMYVLFTKNRSLFKSYIVFPNETDLNVQSGTPAIHLKNLCQNIESNNRHIMTYEDVNKICKKIEERNIYSKENLAKHRARIKKLY